MKLFWKIFFPIFSFLFLMAGVLSYKITQNQIAVTQKHYLSANESLGDYHAHAVKVGYFEQHWPFESLRKLSQRDAFLFWWIVEDNGNIYLANDVRFVQTNVKNYYPEIQKPERNIKSTHIDWNQQFAVYVKNVDNSNSSWTFWYGFSLHELSKLREELILLAVILPFFGLIIAGLALYLVVKHVTRPIQDLVIGTEHVAQGNFNHKIDVSTADEFGLLSTAFNNMSANLRRTTTSIEKLNKEVVERVQSERQARDAEEKAQKAERAKSTFLANMSHEIRTPINAILGFSDILSQQQMDRTAQEYLKTLQNSGEHLLRIINDILDLSKFESGQISVESIRFDFHELVINTMRMLQPQVNVQTIDFFLRIDDSIPRELYGDPTRIRQILTNLLANAAKFTKQGEIGVFIKGKWQDEAQQDNIILNICVHDTGLGIPAKHIDTIFSPFDQVDASTTRKYGGTGLGLSICKSLIHAMQGEIWVTSEYGKGSDFHISLPLKAAEPEDTLDTIEATLLAGKNVLVVDSQKNSRNLLQHQLEALGCQGVFYRASPPSSDEIKEKIHIIFIEFTGNFSLFTTVLENLRQKPAFIHSKVIVLSRANHEAEIELQECIDGILIKPFARHHMTSLIHQVLDPVSTSPENICQYNHYDKQACVLVVEDNVPNQMIMRAYLERLACRHEIVENGKLAVERLGQQHEFNLCLMDMQMPVMDGVEATKLIRETISKSFPIIMLTASVLSKDKEGAISAGANDYISKPISLNQLNKVIKKYSCQSPKALKESHQLMPEIK